MSNLRKQLCGYVSEIENVEAEIAKLNKDKSELYRSAKDADLNVAALRRVIAYRRKRAKGDPVDEAEERFAEYLGLVENESPRVRVHEAGEAMTLGQSEGHSETPYDPDTGEPTEPVETVSPAPPLPAAADGQPSKPRTDDVAVAGAGPAEPDTDVSGQSVQAVNSNSELPGAAEIAAASRSGPAGVPVEERAGANSEPLEMPDIPPHLDRRGEARQ